MYAKNAVFQAESLGVNSTKGDVDVMWTWKVSFSSFKGTVFLIGVLVFERSREGDQKKQ